MRAHRPILVTGIAVSAFLLIPMVMTALASLERDIFAGPRAGLTLHWLTEAIASDAPVLILSLTISICCLLVTTLIGVPCAYALSRARGWRYRLLERMMLIPLAMPGLTLAMAMVQSYSKWSALRQSAAFIVAGHVLMTLPLMIAAIRGVLAVNDCIDTEAAAASLGAGFIRRFCDVIIPACRPGIVAGGLQVVTVSLGEFNLTWLLHTPNDPTLTTALADAYATSRLESASASTVLFIVLILPALLLVQRLNARGGASSGISA